METQKNERSWQRSWSQQSDRGSVGIRYLRPEPKSCSSTVPACLGRASPWQWLISQGWRELHSRDPVSVLLTMTLAWHLHSGHSLNKENIWINQNMLSKCPNTTMTLSQQFHSPPGSLLIWADTNPMLLFSFMFLAVPGLRCCVQPFSSSFPLQCSLQLLIVVASLVVEGARAP